jgi:hypothetical protein
MLLGMLQPNQVMKVGVWRFAAFEIGAKIGEEARAKQRRVSVGDLQ